MCKALGRHTSAGRLGLGFHRVWATVHNAPSRQHADMNCPHPCHWQQGRHWVEEQSMGLQADTHWVTWAGTPADAVYCPLAGRNAVRRTFIWPCMSLRAEQTECQRPCVSLREEQTKVPTTMHVATTMVWLSFFLEKHLCQAPTGTTWFLIPMCYVHVCNTI